MRRGVAVVAGVCLLAACAAETSVAWAAQVEQSAQVVGQYEKLELTIGYLRFHDVGWDNWALGEIEACVEAGIVRGCPDGSYRPGATVDRAQMAVYIARGLAGSDDMVPAGPATATFFDVPIDHWAFAHIEYAVSEGVVQGFADSLYRPEEEVDRAQMAAFVARAMAGGEAAVPDAGCTEPPFSDVPCDFWARKHVQYLVANRVTGGYGDGTYRPDTACSRNQMAAYMARAFGKGGADLNVFDPEQIAMDAIFTAPSGECIEVPGFYYRPYQRLRFAAGESEWEVVQATGGGVFKVRFAWAEVGDYSYEVVATSETESRSLGTGTFAVAPSDKPGYLRISEAAPGYFQHETGEPYFAIGENMSVMYGLGTYNYEAWMTKLAEHGGNHVRVWLCYHMSLLDLEHLPRRQGDGNGLGRYDQAAAWRADYVLELADQLGIRVMLTVETANSVNMDRADGAWHRSPYNQANGGPCHEPMDFFTDEEAKRLYRQRLRYLVGRWGYSTSVLAWELWNEVDGATGYLDDVASVAGWHEEMGAHLRSVDLWAHLRTTSCGWDRGGWEMNDVAEIDYVQSHLYCAHDMAGAIHEACEDDAQYGKPYYPGEFGVGEEDKWSDPEGVALHNGVWAAMLSGAAGTAMNWSWNVVDEYDLYRHFAAVAAFASDVDWVSENYLHESMMLEYPPGEVHYTSLRIEPTGVSWHPEDRPNQPTGCDPCNRGPSSSGWVDNSALSQLQHGVVEWPDLHNPVTFWVGYPAPGAFEVEVAAVSGSGGAALDISLDGTTVLSTDFPDDLPDTHAPMHQYDGVYSIDVPGGEHVIVVENPGAAWFHVGFYRLSNYVTEPPLRALALKNETSALLWVQNTGHTWWAWLQGWDPEPVGQCNVRLTDLAPGTYELEQWDTYTGEVADRWVDQCTDGTISLTTPDGLLSDVAYKVRLVEAQSGH